MSGVRAIRQGFRAGRRWRWRTLLPDRWSWVRLCASPSSYLLLLAALTAAAAKVRVIAALDDVTAWPMWSLVATAPDAALFAALASLFAAGERRATGLLLITVPTAVLVAAFAAASAAYLAITGEQLTWQAVSLGIDRFGDLRGIMGAETAGMGWSSRAALLVAAAVPLTALWMLRRSGRSLHPAAGPGRAHAAGLCAVLALAIVVVAPRPRVLEVERLGASAVLHTGWGWLTRDVVERSKDAGFEGYVPRNLVAPETIVALRAADRPSVVLLVMESTGRNVTSLRGAGALARTPHLEELAADGLEVIGARAVVPHTTKSLFSILCARLPLMQLSLMETTPTIEVQCLPAILRAAGWRTAFFQSAVGVFEDRPRLIRNFGFADFAAWEDIGGDPAGYLASDDGSLAGALAGWLDRAPDRSRPFFATLLTSATHHPYAMPPAAEARARAAGRAAASPRDRHARLVEEEDLLLGQVRALLRQRGLDRRTIVVVVGDHGEGFGDKGVRQHDNNFYEEGLHVPWVMAGPGVAHARMAGDASLVDVTPTILEIVGAPLTPVAARSLPGRSLLRGSPGSRLLVFYCWQDARCRGLVDGGRKVVSVPDAHTAFWFDLAADPEERSPQRLTAELERLLRQASALVNAHRTGDWPPERAAMNEFPPWSCPAGQPCRHPRSPPGGMFGTP
ncbi:MAG TPA: sulfatase-like hydrolase/transferase [Kofleriaceae bacterium]|nr:sulfatase-like hydrolase/transferase [Kofleriaceae bacterium]